MFNLNLRLAAFAALHVLGAAALAQDSAQSLPAIKLSIEQRLAAAVIDGLTIVRLQPRPAVVRGQMAEERKPLVMPTPEQLGIPTVRLSMPTPEALGIPTR